MKRYDAVLFDLDGTLLDTLSDLTDAVNHIMRRFGFAEHTPQAVRGFVGNGVRQLIVRAIPDGAANPRFDQAVLDFRVYYTDHCRDSTQPYRGILPLLTALERAGVRLAIVSNKNDEAVQALRARFFDACVHTAVGDDGVRRRKPAPDSVELALARLGAEKSRALYVGDSEVDFETAQNAGLDCVLVSWGFRGRAPLAELPVRAVIDRPEELSALLEA